MPSAWLTEFMANLDGANGARQPTTQEIAADIIKKSNKYHYNTPVVKAKLASSSSSSKGKKGPSTLQRIFDVISRPLYGSANAYKARVQHDLKDDGKISVFERLSYLADPLNFEQAAQGHFKEFINPYKAAAKGIAGKDKTTFGKVLNISDPGMNKYAKGALGFGLDVLADPSTYIPGGAILKGIKGAGKGAAVAKDATKLGDVIRTSKAATPVERVHEAYHHPVYSFNPQTPKHVPLSEDLGTKAVPKAVTGVNLANVPTHLQRTLNETKQFVDKLPKTASVSEELANTKALLERLNVPKPAVVAEKAATKVEPKKTAKALAEVVAQPGRKIDVMKLVHAGIPRGMAAEIAKAVTPTAAKPLKKLSVDAISKIEVSRALGKNLGNITKEHTLGSKAVSDAAEIPVYSLSGGEISKLPADKVHEYLKTGKIDAPKAGEVPETDMSTMKYVDPEAGKKFESHLFSEKDAPKNFYVKNVKADGSEELVSLATVRARIAATAKKRKLPKESEEIAVAPVVTGPVTKPVDTTAWRKLAKEHGLTKAEQDAVLATKNDIEAVDLLKSYADKPIVKKAATEAVVTPPAAPVAAADDLIEAAKTGDETAVTAMERAVNATTQPKNTMAISEGGGRAIEQTVNKTIEGIKQGNTYNLRRANPHFNPAKQANAFGRLEAALVDNEVVPGKWKMGKERLKTVSKDSKGKTHPGARARRETAMAHLVEFEDQMIAAGHPPTLFDGTPARLSDLINAAGGLNNVLRKPGVHLTDLFGNREKLATFLADNPKAQQVVETSRAAHAAQTADLVKEGKDAAISGALKAENDPTLTAAEVSAARTAAPSAAEQVVKAAASVPNPEAARMAKENVKELLDHATPPVNRVIIRYNKPFNDAVWTGKISPTAVAGQITKEKSILTEMDVLPVEITSEVSKADNSRQAWGITSSLGKKFVPDWGQKDLRPIFVENRSIAQTNTARFDNLVNGMSKNYSDDDMKIAFRALQGGQPVANELQTAAALDYQKAMELMFGATGFKDAATTDVLREAITMGEVNSNLAWKKSPFRFTDTIKDPVTGKPVKLEHWTDAWKYHNLDDQHPSEFMKQLRDAVDHSMMEKNMFDQIALFGKQGGKATVAHQRLAGVKFDPEMASQVKRFIQVLDDTKNPNSKFFQNMDAAMSYWKKGVTYFAPSHHIRNLFGDTTLAWMAGVNNPIVYSKAMQVLKSNKHLYSDLGDVGELIAPGGTSRALSRQSTRKIVRARFKGGSRDLDASQVYQIMYDRGLLPHAKTVEDIPGGSAGSTAVDKAFGKLPQPLGGRGKKVAMGVSESREHFVRTAHFIDAIGKAQQHGAQSIEEAIQHAVSTTRKWHPDGLDLTDFEHRWMRRVFPFYSWTRKAIPLMIEGALKKPAKIIAPNKALYNLQLSMGLNPQSLSVPFPEGQQYPDWIRDLPYGPAAGGPLGAAGRYIVGNNLNPIAQTGAQLLNDPRRGAAGMLNPAARIPAEVLTQTDSQTGQPFSTMDKTEYIDKQIPLISYPNSILGGNFGAGSVEALATGNSDAMLNHKNVNGTESPTARRDALLNFLLAAGIIDTQSASALKSAEYDQRDRLSKLSKG